MTPTTSRRGAALLLVCLAWTSLPAAAQPMGGKRGLLGPPSFMRHLYLPRVVMRNQEAIGLDDDQRAAISDAVGEAQKRLTELEWQREALAEEVGTLVEGTRIDETAAMAKASELMAVELDIKREHLRLLMHIKNQLTAEQQTKAAELQQDARSDRRQRFLDRRGPPSD